MKTIEEILEYVRFQHSIGYNLGPNPPSGYRHQMGMTPVANYLSNHGLLHGKTKSSHDGTVIFEGEEKIKYDLLMKVWNNDILPVWYDFYEKRRWRNWLIRIAVMALSGFGAYYMIAHAHTSKFDVVENILACTCTIGVFGITLIGSVRRIEKYYRG